MTKIQFAVLAALLSVLVMLQIAPYVTPSTVQRDRGWSYRIEGIPDLKLQTELGLIGDAGWEVVFARRATDSGGSPLYEIIFKRPK